MTKPDGSGAESAVSLQTLNMRPKKHNLLCPFECHLLNESPWLHYGGGSQKIRRKVAGKTIGYSLEAHFRN